MHVNFIFYMYIRFHIKKLGEASTSNTMFVLNFHSTKTHLSAHWKHVFFFLLLLFIRIKYSVENFTIAHIVLN